MVFIIFFLEQNETSTWLKHFKIPMYHLRIIWTSNEKYINTLKILTKPKWIIGFLKLYITVH